MHAISTTLTGFNSIGLLGSNNDSEKIPKLIVWAIIGLSITPFIMTLFGIDFGNEPHPFDATILSGQGSQNPTETAFLHLAGSFTHTILEWSAFCIAIFTVCLAFNNYSATHDATMPIIGVALICAGCMDAFHTLAADRLITAVADNRSLIPFTWAICRVFNALILATGVALLLVRKQHRLTTSLRFVLTISALFGIIAYAIIQYSATHTNLPQTMFPDELITRPWDFGPLLLYLFLGLYLFPLFYRKHPSIFAHALIISAIPDVAVEAHMAFGSTALFDSHFNIAHFLKIVAYIVPLIGLVLDHAHVHTKQKITLKLLGKTSAELAEKGSQLAYLIHRNPAVIYSMDLANNFQPKFIGQNVLILTGHRPRDMLSPGFWEDHVHPDDLANVLSHLSGLFDQGGKVHNFEYRFQHKQGHYLWINDTATINYSKAGQPLESIGSWMDITEAKNKEAAILRVNEELDQFAYIASHDLKEPLRGIHNYSNFLLEDYAEVLDEEGRSKLETLTRLTQRMENLINSLLEFSRLGREKPSLIETDLNELLRETLDTLQFSLQDNNTALLIPKPLPNAVCDRVLVSEVFANLISNAIKYNDKPDQWIEVGCVDDKTEIDTLAQEQSLTFKQGTLVYYIRDNGIGIREKHLDSVFRIFKRLHGRDKFGGGTGVGLTIVKKIIDRHEGHIWVESSHGEGTIFYFTLSGSESHA